MVGMLRNKILLEQGNNRILRWSLWLDKFNFYIDYKMGKYNCLGDLLTREAALKEIKMFSCSSASTSSVPPSALEGFQLVLICKYCHMPFFFNVSYIGSMRVLHMNTSMENGLIVAIVM